MWWRLDKQIIIYRVWMWPAPAIEYIELVHFENITVEVVKCDHFGKGFGH